MLFNISNNDLLETISMKFDELPLPLASYGIAVGDERISTGSSGVQHLSFHLNLTTFSPGLQSKSLTHEHVCPPLTWLCCYCSTFNTSF
jgi:hypothetical protein